MKHHPAWLAIGLLVFVVLACNLGRQATTNVNTNSNTNTPTPSSETIGGSGVAVKEVHMAKDDGNGDPGEQTTTFAPSDRTVHCVATLKESKSGTQMRFSWWIVDADGEQNRKFKDINYRTRTFDNVVHGHLTAPQNWPVGKYKVEVYVNGDLDRTAFYTVQ